MEEILKNILDQNGNKKTEQQFENLLSLSIALIAKRANIKNMTSENFDDLLSESEYASFWKKIKEVYFEKNIKEKNQERDLIKKAIEIQKFEEEKISSALIYLIDFLNESEKENINKLISKILNISPNLKVADAYGKKGFLSLELMQKYNCFVDYYETNKNNVLKALIRFCVFNEMCNIVECLPGVLRKTKYDLVIANPENEINLIAPANNKDIQYDRLKMLIDEENIYGFKISNDMSPYFFISLIIVSMLKNEGKAIISVPVECLSNNSNEKMRKYFVDNYLDEIIILPDHIYPYMKLNEDNTKFALLIFKKNKSDNVIKYSNLEYCYNPKESYNEIDIDKALEQYKNNNKKITREKIIKNNYSLDPEKYIKDIEINFAVNLDEVTTDIFRGYQFGKEELKKMKPKNDEEINYRIFKNNEEKIIGINSRNKNLDRYLLKSGDIIINARGEENTIYSLTKSIEESKYIAIGSTIVIRPDEEKINNKYLELFLKNKKGNILLNKIKNKNAIYVGNLKKLKIACPEKETQEKIINKIAKLEKELFDLKNCI